MVEEKKGREQRRNSKVWCLAQKKNKTIKKLKKRALEKPLFQNIWLSKYHWFMYLLSDSDAQQGHTAAPHPTRPCAHPDLVCVPLLSLQAAV